MLDAGANLRFAELEGTDLGKARLAGADLIWVRLQGADLRKARFTGADLFGARLAGADLREAQLEGADLRKARIAGAEFSGAHLGLADLRRLNRTPLGTEEHERLVKRVRETVTDEGRRRGIIERLKQARTEEIKVNDADPGKSVLCDKNEAPYRQCIAANETDPRMAAYFDSLAGLACRNKHVAAGIARRAADIFTPELMKANLSRVLFRRYADHVKKPCAGVAALPETTITGLRRTVSTFEAAVANAKRRRAAKSQQSPAPASR